jgi:preprotein translocase subunit Sss1
MEWARRDRSELIGAVSVALVGLAVLGLLIFAVSLASQGLL